MAAADQAPPHQVDLTLRVLINGQPAAEPHVLAPLGQAATLTLPPDDSASPGDTAWQLESRTTPLPDGRLQVDSLVRPGQPLTLWDKHSLAAAAGETRQWFVSDLQGQQVICVYQTAELLPAKARAP